MQNKITLRSVYGKAKKYYFNPVRGKNGLYPSFVKQTVVDANGNSEMILSEAEKNSPERAYFIPVDMIIEVTDGKTFNLDDPYENNLWECIKNSKLIAPERDARDEHGNFLIDGNIRRYGTAELYIERAGVEAKRRISRIQLVNKAYSFITDDTDEHRKTICKLLGKSVASMPDVDIQDYLYSKAEQNPNLIIEIYTSSDQALKLLLIEAKQKNIITNQSGVLMYADTALGVTDDAAILFFKDPTNKAIYDSIKYETYPEYKVANKASKKDKE
jgi:hypothetical protein